MASGISIPLAFQMNRQKKKPRQAKFKIIPTNDPIEIRYKHSYQIDYIHSEIIRRLESKVGIPELIEEMKKLGNSLNEKHTIIDYNSILENIRRIMEEINYINSGKKLEDYLKQSDYLVYQYSELPHYVEYISFDNESNIESDMLSDEEIQRLNIIENYFDIAKKFAPINAIRDMQNEGNGCINCSYDLVNVKISDDGLQECPNCGESTYVFTMSGHKGTKSGSGTRCYDVENTYRRELLQFLGEGKVHVPDDLYIKLEEYFISQRFPPANEIKKRSLDVYGKRLGTSLTLLNEALKAIGYPSFYKHANKIGKQYWGWKLHDELLDQMSLLMQDFRDTQKHINSIDKCGRSSNVCSQSRIMYQLWYRDAIVAPSDFKLPGDDALRVSEFICKQLFNKAGFKFRPMFPEEEINLDKKGFLLIRKNNSSIKSIEKEENIKYEE